MGIINKKREKRRFIILKSLCLCVSVVQILFCCAEIFGQSKIAVRVAAETVVSADRVTLGDVAEISGETEKIERLKRVALGYAPNVGAVREIERSRIELAAAAAGFSPEEISFDAPPRILLKRGGQKLSSDLLREEIEKAVLPAFQANGATATIVRLDLPENLEIPAGKIAVKAAAAAIVNFSAPFGVALEIRVDERVVKRLNATLQIEVSAPVFVAVKNLISGASLRETDVRVETRRLEKPLSNYLRDANDLRGAVMLKNLAAGAETTRDAVAAGIVVKNGDLIRIVGESGKFKISITGEARAAGRIGDRIAVKNLQSGATLQAVVIDEGVVQIRF